MTLLEEFSKGLEGKDLNQLIHEAKADSERRILGQGIASLALFISQVMVEAMAASGQQGLGSLLTPATEQPATPPRG